MEGRPGSKQIISFNDVSLDAIDFVWIEYNYAKDN